METIRREAQKWSSLEEDSLVSKGQRAPLLLSGMTRFFLIKTTGSISVPDIPGYCRKLNRLPSTNLIHSLGCKWRRAPNMTSKSHG